MKSICSLPFGSLMILMSSITFADHTPIGKEKYAHASLS